MARYHPRSIVSLILVGFAVVLTPFIAAVVTAVIQVDRLAQAGRAAVLDAGQATEGSRALVAQLTDMQRALGQFAVRADPDFFTIYLQRRTQFRATLASLLELNLVDLDREQLRTIARDDDALFAELNAQIALPDANRNWGEVTDRLTALATQARTVLAASDRLIQTKANEATARAETVQRTLLLLTAAAVPFTILLVALFTILITRPMQALGYAIRQLGRRSLAAPIQIKGPKDVASLGDELDRLRRRIQALENQKANFLRHISHELKTPLTTIREGSELLTETLGEELPEEAEIARLMQQSGLRLQNLIEDLLEFARTQELGSELELQDDVDFGALLRESVEAQIVVADAKQLEVECKSSPVYVRGDPKKIKTVIDNLLMNAIKYTPELGRITMAVQRVDDRAVLDIRDSGPGVAQADRERVFEPFQQGSAEYQSSVKGTGLGLAIAKEYVEAHHGVLELVDSESGAHFRVALPLSGPAMQDNR
jgi:two-component system sensor histidine kinase GlrK